MMATIGIRNAQATWNSSITPPEYSLELIRLQRIGNCFSDGQREAAALCETICHPRALIRWRMEDAQERELVERCRSGDERAFQELVERYKDLVFAMIA